MVESKKDVHAENKRRIGFLDEIWVSKKYRESAILRDASNPPEQ